MTALSDLARKWETEAELLSKYGDERGSQAAVLHAAELKEALRSHADDLLDPTQAEEFSGYSRRRLRELVSEAKLENHGRPGSPRYRRADLPTKTRVDDGFDPAAEARRLCAS